jgi:prevent-host-death family protein
MDMIPLYDAKNRLSELCNRVTETGEPCIISRRGQPIVKLIRIDPSESAESVWGTVEESKSHYGALDEDFEIPDRSSDQRGNSLTD